MRRWRRHHACVVPQLKSITLGGAVAGVGIEASSFRHGLVHETISAIDVLTGDGRILICTPDNEHRDLFLGLPNSYGTLGYALRLTARTVPVKRYVHVEHRSHSAMRRRFSPRWAGCACRPGDRFSRWRRLRPRCAGRDRRTLRRRRPLRQRLHVRAHLLPVAARTDRRLSDDARLPVAMGYRLVLVLAESRPAAPLAAPPVGRDRLNSITYQKIMRWNRRWKVTAAWDRLRGVARGIGHPGRRHSARARRGVPGLPACADRHPADLGLPDPRARGRRRHSRCIRSRREPHTSISASGTPSEPAQAHPAGFHNRKIEHKVTELGGIKSLYSDSYFTPGEFWEIYNRPAYDALKRKYDPDHALPDLYEKCVLTALARRESPRIEQHGGAGQRALAHARSASLAPRQRIGDDAASGSAPARRARRIPRRRAASDSRPKRCAARPRGSRTETAECRSCECRRRRRCRLWRRRAAPWAPARRPARR